MPRRAGHAGAIAGAGRHQASKQPPRHDSPSSSPEWKSKPVVHHSRSIEENAKRKVVADVLASQQFEAFTALITCAYAVVIGIHSEFTIKESIAMHQANDTDKSQVADHPAFQVLSYIFAGYYLLESTLKIFAFRRRFFKSRHWKWNVFELVLVVAALYEIVTDLMRDTDSGKQQGGGGEWLLLVLRLLKLVKLLRLIRLMRFFHELRTMLLCIVGSLRTLFWTLLMLGLILYIFGIVFIQGVIASLAAGTSVTSRMLIEDHWGSVGGAMITLFEAITGGNDWAGLAQPLQEAGFFYYMLFLFYILFLTIAVLNVLTGIFVDSAMAIGSVGNHEVSLAEHAQEGGMLQSVWDVLEEMDMADRELDWSDFTTLCNQTTIQEFLWFCDLDFPHAEHVFEQMGGGNEKVLSEDFVKGCLQMRAGAAKSLDLCVLMHETKKLGLRLDALAANVQQPLAELLARLGGGTDGSAVLCGAAAAAGPIRGSISDVVDAATSPRVEAVRGSQGGEAELRRLLLSLPDRVAAGAAVEMRRVAMQTLIDAASEMPGDSGFVQDLHLRVPKLVAAPVAKGDDGAQCNTGSAAERAPFAQQTSSLPFLNSNVQPSSTELLGTSGGPAPARQEDQAVRDDTSATSCDRNRSFVI